MLVLHPYKFVWAKMPLLWVISKSIACWPLSGHAYCCPHCSAHRRWLGMSRFVSASRSQPPDSWCPLELPPQEEGCLASRQVPGTAPFLHGSFSYYLFLILRKECLQCYSGEAEKERRNQHRVKAKFSLNRWYFRWPHYSRRINFLENPIHIRAYAVLAGGLPEMAKTQELIFFWPE